MNFQKNLIDAGLRTNPATYYFVEIKKKLKLTQYYLNVGNFLLRIGMF
jgi:hypothetical protein